jgi:hypothetical protein
MILCGLVDYGDTSQVDCSALQVFTISGELPGPTLNYNTMLLFGAPTLYPKGCSRQEPSLHLYPYLPIS